MAGPMNETPKYVVSTTLDKVEWQNSTLLEGGLAEAVTELKAKPGKNIGMSGAPRSCGRCSSSASSTSCACSSTRSSSGPARSCSRTARHRCRSSSSSRTFSTGVVDLTYRPVAA